MAEELKWEEIPSNHDDLMQSHKDYIIDVQHYRAKVPGGWLVKYSKELYRGGVGGMVLVNDPNHEWQIETVREKKNRLIEDMEQREQKKKEEKQKKKEEQEREDKKQKRMGKILKVITKLEDENEVWKRQGVPEEKIFNMLEEGEDLPRDELTVLMERLAVEYNKIQSKGNKRWNLQ